VNVLVTGANGFLGQVVVRRALDAGHDVVALVRPTTDLSAVAWPSGRVDVVRADLRNGLPRASLGDVDAVVHAAAATSGDLAAQLAGSVAATERLLDALDLDRLRRFVHVSSFSVYDFADSSSGTLISADTPLEPHPDRRDPYTIAKMAQERLVRERCNRAGTPLVVVRPGVIFGPGKLWDWGRALRCGALDVVFSPRARFRLTYVDNCADAIVLAIDAPDAAGRTLDIVDDELPTHAGYRRLARRSRAPMSRWWVPVPWRMIDLTGAAIDRAMAGRRAKLPELLARRRQQARWKPFEYSNDAAKQALGWTPQVPIATAVSLLAETTDTAETAETADDRSTA
jgi:2-alkyl-3-oxoalkanoate reductase